MHRRWRRAGQVGENGRPRGFGRRLAWYDVQAICTDACSPSREHPCCTSRLFLAQNAVLLSRKCLAFRARLRVMRLQVHRPQATGTAPTPLPLAFGPVACSLWPGFGCGLAVLYYMQISCQNAAKERESPQTVRGQWLSMLLGKACPSTYKGRMLHSVNISRRRMSQK